MKRVRYLGLGLVLLAVLLAACGDSATVAIQSSPSSAPSAVPTVRTVEPTIRTVTAPTPATGLTTTPNSQPTTTKPTSSEAVPTVNNNDLTAIAGGQIFKISQGTQGRLPNCTVGIVSVRETNGQATATLEVTTLGILRDLRENETFAVGNVRYRISRIFVPSAQSANNRGYIEIKAEL